MHAYAHNRPTTPPPPGRVVHTRKTDEAYLMPWQDMWWLQKAAVVASLLMVLVQAALFMLFGGWVWQRTSVYMSVVESDMTVTLQRLFVVLGLFQCFTAMWVMVPSAQVGLNNIAASGRTGTVLKLAWLCVDGAVRACRVCRRIFRTAGRGGGHNDLAYLEADPDSDVDEFDSGCEWEEM